MRTYLNEMLRNVGEYIDVRINLFKIEAIERNAKFISGITAVVVLSISGIFTLMMLSIAAALYLSSIWGAWYWGFLAVGAFYLLCTLLLFAYRKNWIETPVSNKIIGQYFQTENENEDEQHGTPVEGKEAA